MSDLLTPKENKPFINILTSDATLRMQVPEGTEGAVRRDYETLDGKKGTKHEHVFKKLEGHITNIRIFEGNHGKNILITVEKNDEQAVLSLGVASPFGEDFMKKLPNIDMGKEVSFEPYSFEDDKGKARKGITIKQDDQKIENYYFDPKAKKATNKMPEPEGDTKEFDSDDWKSYFLKVRKFLLKETEKIIKANEWDGENKDVDF